MTMAAPHEYGEIKNQGYSLDQESSGINPLVMGPVEAAEVYRAAQMEVRANRKLKSERRNFKGY